MPIIAADLTRGFLPYPWIYGVTSDGRIYFINDKTKTTSWLHPATRNPVQTGFRTATGLPTGWELSVTPEGAVYYIDHISKQTTFVHPITKLTSAASPAKSRISVDSNSARQHIQPQHKLQAANVNNNVSVRKSMPAPDKKKRILDRTPSVKHQTDEPSEVSMRGWLYKQERGAIRTWKRRWCVLADFCLFYYKDLSESGSSKGSILLPSYKVNPCSREDGIKRKFAFKIEHENMQTYYFAAENKDDMHRWMNVISLATIVHRDHSLENTYQNGATQLKRGLKNGLDENDNCLVSATTGAKNLTDGESERLRVLTPNRPAKMDYQSISHQKPLNGQYYHDHHDHDDVHSNFAQNDRRDDGKSSRVYAGRVNARTLNYDDYMDMNSAYDRRGDSARNPSGNSDPQRNGYYADRGAVRDAEPIYENQGVYNRGEAERVRSPGDSEQRPPVPAEFRTRFIEQLADTQTPTTRTSYLMSAYNEEKKKSYPTFFQFPESPPSQEQRSVPKLTAAPPSNRSQQPKQEEWQIHRGHRIRVLVQRSPKAVPVRLIDDHDRSRPTNPPENMYEEIWTGRQQSMPSLRVVDDGGGLKASKDRWSMMPDLLRDSDRDVRYSEEGNDTSTNNARSVRKIPTICSLELKAELESHLCKKVAESRTKYHRVGRINGPYLLTPACSHPEWGNGDLYYLSSSRDETDSSPEVTRVGESWDGKPHTWNSVLDHLDEIAERNREIKYVMSDSNIVGHVSPRGVEQLKRKDREYEKLFRTQSLEVPSAARPRVTVKRGERTADSGDECDEIWAVYDPDEVRNIFGGGTSGARMVFMNKGQDEAARMNYTPPDDMTEITEEGFEPRKSTSSSRPDDENIEENLRGNTLSVQDYLRNTQQQYPAAAAGRENAADRAAYPSDNQDLTMSADDDDSPIKSLQDYLTFTKQRNSGQFSEPCSDQQQQQQQQPVATQDQTHSGQQFEFEPRKFDYTLPDYLRLPEDRNSATADDSVFTPYSIQTRPRLSSDPNIKDNDGGNVLARWSADPLLADPRFVDPRLADPQFTDLQYAEKRYVDPQLADRRFVDPQLADPQFVDPQFTDQRFVDPQLADPQFVDPQLADPRFVDPQFTDQRFVDPQLADPRFVDPQLADRRFVDPQLADPRFVDPQLAEPRFVDPQSADRFVDPQLADRGFVDPQLAESQILEPLNDSIRQDEAERSQLEQDPLNESWPLGYEAGYTDIPGYEHTGYVNLATVPADQRRDIPLSSAPPSSTANPPQRNHDLIPAINTIKEDPEMPDADILETRLRSLRKNYSLRNGQRVRLSIQMADLEGKSHEELVLLLIQLRREQSTLERQRDHLRTVLDGQRDSEKQYKSSIDENQDPSGSLVNQHESYMITKAQINDLDNQIEVQKPLVNLLDNLVKMGSLYNGQTDMLLSQYKTHMLSPDQIKPEKEMLTFTRQLQEDKLVKGQQDDIDQLRQEDADLEEKLRKLHLLDRELQELSVAVTSLREDKLMMEGAISDTKREQHQRKDDPRDMELLDKQLQMQENQLSKIMFELAEKSKQLEEVRAENDKVEMDVTLLRSKVYDLSKSNSLPSMTSESYRAKMKLKDELSQVQGIMDGLKSDAQQLSAAMNTLRKSNPDLTAVDSVPKKMKSKTYLETDMDTMRTVDIGVKTQDSGLRRANSAREVGEIDDSFVSSDMSPMDISQADDNTKRYFGLIPPKESKKNTVRDVKRESGRRVRGSPVRPVDQYQSGNLTRSQSLPRSFEVSPQFPRQDEPSPTDDDQVDSLIAGQQPWRKEAPNQNSPHAIAPSPTNSASSWHGNDPMRNYTDLSQLPPSAWNSGSLPRHKPASQSENSRKSPSTYINLPESRVKSPYSDIRDESRLSGQTNSPNTSFTQRVPFDPLQTRFKSPIGEPEMSPIRVNTPIRAQIVPEMQQTPGRVQSPIRGQIVAEMQQTPGSVQSPIRAQTEAEMQQMPGRVQSPIRAQTEAEMQTPVHRSPNTDSEVRTQFWQPPHLQRNNESSSPQRWKPSYSDSMQSPVNTRKDYLDSAQKEPIYVNTRSYSSLTPENRPIPTSPSASRKPYESPERRSTAPMRDSPTRRTVDSSQQPRSVSPAFRGRDLDFTSQGNLPQASHVFVNDSLDNSSEFMSPRTTSAPSIYDTQRITGQYLPPRYDDHNSADDSSQFVSPKSTPNQRFSPMPGSPWIDDRNLDVDSEVTSSKPMSPIYDRDQRRPISPVTQQRGQISNLTRAASSPASSQPRNHSGSTSHYAKPNKPRYNNNNGKNFARTPPSNDEPAQLQVHTDTVSTLKRSRSETDRDIDEMDRLFGVQKQVNPSWGMRANYEYDDDSDIIDREILRSPELIEIPERYIPEVENLTEFEYEKRQEKAEKLRRLLSAQSMQEFTHAEIDNNGSREMDVHDKVNQEKLQRQAVLEMRQSIAKQVIQRSKEVAEAAKQRNDERRRTLSGGAVELKT